MIVTNERLKEIRSFLGLSRNKFAERIGKTGGFIADVESGRSGMSERTIQDICIVFRINDSWLRDGTGQMFKEEPEKTSNDLDGIA